MELKVIDGDFSVCKVEDLSQVNLDRDFYFIGKTDEELSLVCRTGDVPQTTVSREDGFPDSGGTGFLPDWHTCQDIGHTCQAGNRHFCGVNLQHGLCPDQRRSI